MKTALISGITGQDGSYLAELLLAKDYYVHGIVRKTSTFGRGRIDHLQNIFGNENSRLILHYGDLIDSSNILSILETVAPDEIYNLGAQSHVMHSFVLPYMTHQINTLGCLNLLEGIRVLGLNTKFYQASSSEMFGNCNILLDETSKFHPVSPYGISKLSAHYLTQQYRNSYGIYAVGGILFNHESPRRHESFVTRKISKAVAEIFYGKRASISLGNLEAKRDWGYAPEYVEAIYSMLQQSEPNELVIATGESYSVKNFLEFSFGYVGLDWQEFVQVDQKLIRPNEIDTLTGNSSLAQKNLSWKPVTTAKRIAEIMVEADLKLYA